jgi:hypothetical protein
MNALIHDMPLLPSEAFIVGPSGCNLEFISSLRYSVIFNYSRPNEVLIYFEMRYLLFLTTRSSLEYLY